MKFTRRQLTSTALACLGGGLTTLGLGMSNRAFAQSDATLEALWWDWDPWNQAATEIFQDFRRETGVGVQLNLTPFSDLRRASRAIPQQRQKPSLVLSIPNDIRWMAALGVLRPLDDVTTSEDLDDFLPVSRRLGTWQGRFYSPSMDEASQGLYYNREIVDRYNIRPPNDIEDIWTWPEAREVFIEVQAKERERRGTDRFWALNVGSFNASLGGGLYNGLPHIMSNGERGSPTFKAISDDGLTANGYLNTPESLEAFSFMQRLYQDDQLLPLSTTTDFFPNEQVAFWHGNMSQRYYINNVNPDLEWGVTFLPYHKTPVFFSSSFMVGVIADAPGADMAAQAVKHLVNADNGLKMALAARDLPLRRSNWSRAPGYDEPPLELFLRAHRAFSVPVPVTLGGVEYRTLYEEMQADIYAGAPVEDTVQSAVEKIDAQLQRYAGVVE